MRRVGSTLLVAAALSLPVGVAAQGMMGGGLGMPNGTGVLVVAADGSILVTQMGMSMMGGAGGANASLQRAIIDIGPDGKERWRATFTAGWPMTAATNGDLATVVLVNSSWMWQSMSSMGWWPWGTQVPATTDNAVLVGLSLASGSQLWSAALPGDLGSQPLFSADGSRIYVAVTDFGQAGMMGSGPIRQGDTGGWATQMTNKVVALDRSGTVQWTVDLSASGGMMR